MEDKLLGKEVLRPPERPSDSGADQAIFVSRNVDRHDSGDPEVPNEVGVDEGSDEPSGGGVDVDLDVEAGLLFLLVEESSELNDVFILSGVCDRERG